MNKVHCDECREEFELSELTTNLKEDLPDGIERYYMECPSCKAQYTSYYLNDEIKTIQSEIQRLLKKRSLKIKQKNKLNGLQNRLIRELGELKASIENSP